MHRRKLISGAGLTASNFLAGCSSLFQPTEPNPRVVEFTTEPVSGTAVPTTTVSVAVVNNGGPGNVLVIFVVVDAAGTVLKTIKKEIHMLRDRRQELSFQIQLRSSSDSIQVRAEPA